MKAMASSVSEIRIGPRAERRASWHRLVESKAAMAIVSPLLLLAIWEITGRLGWLDQRFFPVPSSIAVEFVALLRSGELLVNLGWTVQRVAIGFVFGAVPAILLGLVMGLSPLLTALLRPCLLYTSPSPRD